jgi:UDPglucose 6-dehydrogenase
MMEDIAFAGPTISVIGLGKLGLPTAACLARAGFTVIGCDLNPQVVQSVNDGRSYLFEPGVQELLEGTRGTLVATTDISRAVSHSDITFIIVPTPSDPNGAFSVRAVESVCQSIAYALRNKDGYHLVNLVSTVMPGSCAPLIRLIEKTSGKRCGPDFGFTYNPEFVALGSVVNDWVNPDLVLIGESDEGAGEVLERVYNAVLCNSAPILRRSIINAEIAKLLLNAFLVFKIGYANFAGHLCENVDGADVDAVTSVLGFDSRIGHKYLTAGAPAGGTCLPRDIRAVMQFSSSIGAGFALARVLNEMNEEEIYRLAATVRNVSTAYDPPATVVVRGVAFKPGTDVTEESPGLKLAEALESSPRLSVYTYDPVVTEEDLGSLTLDANVTVIMTKHQEWEGLEKRLSGERQTVIDVWRILDRDKLRPGTTYLGVGLGRQDHIK